MKNEVSKSRFSEAVMKATGKLEYQLTNDGLFKLVLQNNSKVLKGLISSVLHIPKKNIRKLKVENPIILGQQTNDKTFVLDIKVTLNDNVIIQLEMQVIDQKNWNNRSLSYLCREFDSLQKGEDYNSVKPVVHVGFLDFDLFDDDAEFYSKYRMLNVKNHREYNSNFTLNVLYLRRIENATEEDKKWKIDEWARLFKAKTWEDIRMIAENNEAMVSAVETIFEIETNQDKLARDLMERRQEEIIHKQWMQRERKMLKAEVKKLKTINENLKVEAAKAEEEKKALKDENERLKALLSDKE